MKKYLALTVCLIATSHMMAQSFCVQIRDIDYTHLPRILFSLCVTGNNSYVQNITASDFILL